MKSKLILAIMLVSMLATILMVSMTYSQTGPEMDVLRHLVIESPDAALIAMQTDVADMSPDQIRTADIEKQDADGMLITEDLGFHMGFIAYNLRADQSYRRPELLGKYWPLKDAEFRHALIHSYDQLGIIAPIYGYVVTPVRSLVPPAQSKYYNPGVPAHPYNPGSPFTSPAGEHSTCGILLAKGYTFVDAGTIGVVDDADTWLCPNGDSLPEMRIFTPLMTTPTSYMHGAQFVADLAEVGLASTAANGNHGMLHLGYDFNQYLALVYDDADFDAYMVFYSLGRIPDQLYSLLHTSQDCLIHSGRRNAVGVNDPTIDALCDTVKFSLDTDAIETAAKEIQELLYTPDKPNADNFALSYMLLYSRSYFNAFDEDLEGIVKSPGYGSDNSWTFFNVNWKAGTERIEGGKTVLVYINGLPPAGLNPTYATTVYEWNIIGATMDGLTDVNPYNHYDIPWIASGWTLTATVDGMDIDLTLRGDVDWQDGKPFTAYDVEFCLEFLRDRHVPRFAETWETLIDVAVTDATHCTIHVNKEGVGLFYDYMGLATILPEHIWNRSWASDQAVLDYDPTEAYNVASGYTAGPNPPPTNLFGTGPWIFQFYDDVAMYDDMWRNENYFMSTAAIAALKADMFWEVGDYSKDGVVNVVDLTFVSFAYGCIQGLDLCYDADADFNSDGIVDMRDIYTAAYHLLWQKEYP